MHRETIFRFVSPAAAILAIPLLCGAEGPVCGSSPILVGYDEAGAPIDASSEAAPPSEAAPTSEAAPPPDGVGPTLGGCPAAEPVAGSACAIPGRLCKWTRSCGAVDTGWCLPSSKWRVAPGFCKVGCPGERPVPGVPGGLGAAQMSSDGGGGVSSSAGCGAGTDCFYPSTPLDTGVQCSCQAQRDGTTAWGACNPWNDGWVPAPPPGTAECGELKKCSGGQGCADACPNPGARSCGCGDDGLLYCQVNPC